MRLALFLLLASCEVDGVGMERPADQRIDETCWYTKDIQARRDCHEVRALPGDAGVTD